MAHDTEPALSPTPEAGEGRPRPPLSATESRLTFWNLIRALNRLGVEVRSHPRARPPRRLTRGTGHFT